MKNLIKFSWMAFLMAITIVLLPSCHKDNDDLKPSDNSVGFFKVGSQKTDFYYAYRYYEDGEINFVYTTYDLQDCNNNPSKYESKRLSSFLCGINNGNFYFEASINGKVVFDDSEWEIWDDTLYYAGDDDTIPNCIQQNGSSFTITGTNIEAEKWTHCGMPDEQFAGNVFVNFNFSGTPSNGDFINYRPGKEIKISNPELIKRLKSLKRSK